MSAFRTEADGRLVLDARAYRLELDPGRLRATILGAGGEQLVALRPLAALDTTAAPDETVDVAAPELVDERTVLVARTSSVWERAKTTIVCGEETVELRAAVAGRGDLDDVHLLGFRSVRAGAPLGFVPSGSSLRTLFTPGPSEPPRLVRPAGEAAYVGVLGDGAPGRGRWLFTPAPLLFALTASDGPESPAGEWVSLGLAAPVDELAFPEVAYVPVDGGFHLRLAYEGHTRVDGSFEAPAVLVTPGLPDPYTAIRRHRDDLAARGAAPAVTPRDAPDWWREPVFCGWGAQCALARGSGRFAGEYATQENYDRFLEELEAESLVPGTVVIDDKWQSAYGTNEADTAKWPDLAGWIARRHARGGRVLLWWKAWDPEGVPPELCIRNHSGAPVALDPGSEAARALLRDSVHRMLGPEGYDADGLKVDFTARTPSGRSLTAAGRHWGIALLHELLAVVYAAAKEAKPDALVITHTPHPAFVDVTDMIRLNDMSRARAGELGVTGQMRYRAEVARAACPELLVDTDDWQVPDLATWREYAALKPDLGVPSLYYSRRLDATGEELTGDDYELLRRTWSRAREERWKRPA